MTPANVAQLPTGRALDVKMSKEGFEPLKKTVTLTDAEPIATWNAVMSRGSVTVNLAIVPKVAGTVVLLDGQAVNGTNAAGVTSGDQHKLVVGAPGYVDQVFTFIASPQETKHFDVALVKETHHVHHGGAPSPESTNPSSTPGPAGNGKLNVGASPGWCDVTVDGVARGATPVAGIELPAGSHRIVCKPPDGPAMSTTVTVTAEGLTRYKFNLPQ